MEFTFKGTGRLRQIDTFTSKAGKTILTLIVETDGQYPQVLPIKVFGRLADQAPSWKPGATLAIEGRLGGRDWNGKVFGDVVANVVEVVGEDEGRPRDTGRAAGPEDDDGGSLPF